MNVQAEKALIIEQFKKIDDINLIHAIKSMLEYSKKMESNVYDIPEEHQKLVMERFEHIQKNPDELIEWNEAKKRLKSK